VKPSIETLLPQYHKESYHWALLLCRCDREMAKDVLQTAYEKVLHKGQQFQGHARFKTWLFAVIKNTATDAQRTANNQRLTLVPEAPEVADTAAPDHEGTELMQLLLQQLSPMQRQTIQLCFYHNHTLEASAEILGITVGSIRTHYARGKDKLKALIEQHKLKDRLT